MTFAFLIQSKRLWDHEMNVNFHFFISRQNYTFLYYLMWAFKRLRLQRR